MPKRAALSVDARNEAPTHVYIIEVEGRVKIGIAADPDLRRRQISNAVGRQAKIVMSRQFITRLSAADIERRLHKRFARERQSGEWFAVDAAEACGALDAMTDPGLHIKQWRDGMPPEAASSALERFRWRRAKSKGAPYAPY